MDGNDKKPKKVKTTLSPQYSHVAARHFPLRSSGSARKKKRRKVLCLLRGSPDMMISALAPRPRLAAPAACAPSQRYRTSSSKSFGNTTTTAVPRRSLTKLPTSSSSLSAVVRAARTRAAHLSTRTCTRVSAACNASTQGSASGLAPPTPANARCLRAPNNYNNDSSRRSRIFLGSGGGVCGGGATTAPRSIVPRAASSSGALPPLNDDEPTTNAAGATDDDATAADAASKADGTRDDTSTTSTTGAHIAIELGAVVALFLLIVYPVLTLIAPALPQALLAAAKTTLSSTATLAAAAAIRVWTACYTLAGFFLFWLAGVALFLSKVKVPPTPPPRHSSRSADEAPEVPPTTPLASAEDVAATATTPPKTLSAASSPAPDPSSPPFAPYYIPAEVARREAKDDEDDAGCVDGDDDGWQRREEVVQSVAVDANTTGGGDDDVPSSSSSSSYMPMMAIVIETPSGRQLALEVKPSDTVATVKSMIYDDYLAGIWYSAYTVPAHVFLLQL